MNEIKGIRHFAQELHGERIKYPLCNIRNETQNHDTYSADVLTGHGLNKIVKGYSPVEWALLVIGCVAVDLVLISVRSIEKEERQ